MWCALTVKGVGRGAHIITILLLFFCVHCGGGNEFQESIEDVYSAGDDGITVYGFVDLQENFYSLNKWRKADEHEDFDQGQILSWKGEEWAAFDVSPEGYFETVIPRAYLDTARVAPDENGIPIVVVENQGRILLNKITLNGGKELDLGTMNTTSTRGAEGVARSIEGFAGWGFDYSDALANMPDVTCLYDLHRDLWHDEATLEKLSDPDSRDLVDAILLEYSRDLDPAACDKAADEAVQFEEILRPIRESNDRQDLSELLLEISGNQEQSDAGSGIDCCVGNQEEKSSPSKMTICHVPPGNPQNAHVIEIANSAWQAHEAHGDYPGECVARVSGEEDITANPEDESASETDENEQGNTALPVLANDSAIDATDVQPDGWSDSENESETQSEGESDAEPEMIAPPAVSVELTLDWGVSASTCGIPEVSEKKLTEPLICMRDGLNAGLVLDCAVLP